MKEEKKLKRVAALDVTRGISVLGMIYMNFSIAIQGTVESYEYSFITSQQGRFGVLFIFLAGVGISLMNRRAYESGDRDLFRQNRIRLAKRALFLFVTGMIFSLYWFADILHFYAFYILMALPLLRLRGKTLLLLTPLPVIIFIALNFFLNWEAGWDFTTFSYVGFYTVRGFIRNLFFNGFHPIFPWFTFILLGMAAGRKLPEPGKGLAVRLIVSLAVMGLAELISFAVSRSGAGEFATIVFSTRGFPPAPLYVLSSAAQSLAILYGAIFLCHFVSEKNLLLKALASTGKMVMTHYVVHLFAGLIPLFVLSESRDLSILFIFSYSLVYFLLTVVVTTLWNRKFRNGPLEGLMRRLS